MMHSFKIFLFLLTMSVAPFVNSQNNVIDEIVWVVGDEAILKSEVEDYRKEILMQNQRIEGDPYCFIPEQLAIRKLFLDQAKLDSIVVQESNVNRTLEYLVNEYIASTGSVERLEEYYGKKMAGIRDDLRQQIREQQLVEGVQQKHFGNVQLTPSEIRKYYNTLPQDSLPFIPTTLEVQIITAEPVIPLAEIDKVKASLRDYTVQINNGEKEFSTLALLYSEDPSAVKGGELGFMNRSGFVPEFANVAFALNDPKKVSNVVESEYGFHIIQLIEKRGDRINTRHILLKPKVDEKDLEAALLRLDSIANDIRNEKFTFDDAATYISHDKDTRNNHGLMANPQTGTARFEMQQLAQVSQEAAKMVEGMNVGEISKPFTMINAKGKEICAIVKLKTRLNGHKATITEDYQRLKGIVMEKRSEEKLDKWIRDKQKHTYVRINEKWQKCDFKYPGWVKK